MPLSVSSLPSDLVCGYLNDDRANIYAASRMLQDAQHALTSDATAALRCIERAVSLLEAPVVAKVIARGGLSGWQIAKVRRYIDRNIDAPLRVAQLTTIARLSPGHFSKAFKRSFGVSPHAFVVSRRVQHAERMLVCGQLPICAIAVDCGFCDQAHFSRQFRRATGVTPASWRRLYGSGKPDFLGHRVMFSEFHERPN
jgi:AraC family transcriptional regulator